MKSKGKGKVRKDFSRGEKMLKLSKKQLKGYAEEQEAYYFTGNVYNYENVIHYLQQLIYYKEKEDTTEIENNIYKNSSRNYFASVEDIIKNIKIINYDNYSCNQIAYSSGIYGNNGQLHEIKLLKNNNIVANYYCYY